MQTTLDCIPCIIRQALDSVRLITDNQSIHRSVIKQTIDLLSGMDFTDSPPAIAQRVYGLIYEITGNNDPYAEIKQKSNLKAKQLFEHIMKDSRLPSDDFETAVRLAIAGNIIDFGVKADVSDAEIEQSIAASITADIDLSAISRLKSQVNSCRNILYLADNAGEIVFDRFLIQQLPAEKTIVAVRGKPIINDAVMVDAEFAGITDIVKVIGNGSGAPGTIIDDCSKEFRDIFERADLVIAKGQGNYETLSETRKNIFFLFKVKCPVVAIKTAKPIGTLLIGNPKG